MAVEWGSPSVSLCLEQKAAGDADFQGNLELTSSEQVHSPHLLPAFPRWAHGALSTVPQLHCEGQIVLLRLNSQPNLHLQVFSINIL